MIIRQEEEQIGMIQVRPRAIDEHACGAFGIERSVEAFIDAGKPLQLEDY